MKNYKKNLKALALLLGLALAMPFSAQAQTTKSMYHEGSLMDDPTAKWHSQGLMNDRTTFNALTFTITNNGIGQDETPLGSGLLILGAAGAGYAIAKRRKNKKNNKNGVALMLASLMLLGFTQCKKEVIEPVAEGTTYHISIPAGGNNTRANVDPTGAGTYATVSFEQDDKLYIGYNGTYVGYITYNGTNNAFEGNIDVTLDTENNHPLDLYFLGGKDFTTTVSSNTATLNISDQSSHYPVISYAPTETDFTGNGTYAATLLNKCSIMKFNVTTPSTVAICITGMNNQVTVDFTNPSGTDNGFTYDQVNGGLITMPGVASSGASTWAIVLPQAALTTTGGANSVYTTDGYSGVRPTIHEIKRNCYYNDGDEDVDLTVETRWFHLFTATIQDYTVQSAQNRAVTSEGVKTFAVGDQIAVAYQNTSAVQVKAVTEALKAGDISGDGKTATFKVTFTEAPFEYKGNYLYYTYPASITTADGGIDYSVLNTQDGTLATLASNLDLCMAYSGWNGSDDLPALTLTNRLAIGKFTLKNYSGTDITSTITGMTVRNGDNTYTITRSATAGPIWVAMQPIWEGSTVIITATDGTSNYTKSFTIASSEDLLAGNIYPINVTSIPTGAINGLFSVSSTKQVYFSQGNLQYQASTGTWRFAEHQYEFIGNDNIYASEANPDWIDLYRWGTSGIDYTGHATKYLPWETSFNSADFNPYGSLTTNLYDGDGENAGKADWGYNAISNGGNTQNSGWRTLKNNTTDNEWQYIFNSRTTANEINSTSNARYTQARINTDGTLVNGIILFPDGSIGDTPSGVTWGAVNAASDWKTGTQCTTAGWAALEAAGCVFLPASGKGEPSGVSMVETEGYYWSSSCAEKNWSTEYAYGVYFYNNNVRPQYSDIRYYGCSVRLVKDAN